MKRGGVGGEDSEREYWKRLWNSGTFEGWDRNLVLWKFPGLYDGDPSKVS